MAVETVESFARPAESAVPGRIVQGRTAFPAISWGAIFGGLASGMAAFMLLVLLGLAAGFTAIDPQEAEPVGRVPLMTGIWTGISMLISAFIGGYVAARISGMSRKSDGLFHGFVVWGVNTLVFAFLVTTTVGSLLGGAFSVLAQGIQGTLGAAAGMAGEAGSPQAMQQLESLIAGSAGGVEVSQESLNNLQERVAAGDRQGAVNVMVNEMGVAPDRAETLADQAMNLQGMVQQLPSGEEVASRAVTGLTAASWWIFAGLLLSLILSIGGGAVGARSQIKRRQPLAHA